jgi:hypothetical protein
MRLWSLSACKIEQQTCLRQLLASLETESVMPGMDSAW